MTFKSTPQSAVGVVGDKVTFTCEIAGLSVEVTEWTVEVTEWTVEVTEWTVENKKFRHVWSTRLHQNRLQTIAQGQY